MPDLTEIGFSRVTDAIFSEGDLMISAKIVELAISISDKKDTGTIQKNIDNVVHFIKSAKAKLSVVKKA